MKRVSFENEFNEKFIPEDKISSFYEKMKDTVVKICVSLDIDANDENEDVEMNDQEDVRSTRLARKQAAAEIGVVGYAFGTGVLVKKGYVLTADRVVFGAKRVFIRQMEQNDYYGCSIVKSDEAIGLALLKIERNKVKSLTKRVKFTPESDTIIGSEALYIGHPLGYDYTFLRGTVAHSRGMFSGEMANEFYVKNIHGAEGAFGGPVFDGKGLLTGILLSDDCYTGLTVCAHMDVAREFLAEILPGQKPKRPKNGAVAENKDKDNDEEEPKYLVKASGFDGKDVEDEDNDEEEDNKEEEDGDPVFFKLAKLFGEHGIILRIFFPLDETTKMRKGYALIEFKDTAGVNKALLKNGSRLFGKRIKVEAVNQNHS